MCLGGFSRPLTKVSESVLILEVLTVSRKWGSGEVERGLRMPQKFLVAMLLRRGGYIIREL